MSFRLNTITVPVQLDVEEILSEIDNEDILDYIENNGISRKYDDNSDGEIKDNLIKIKDLLFGDKAVLPNELKNRISEFIDLNFVNIIE
jgi:hypothetical protein